MSGLTQNRLRALVLAAAPLVLLVGFVVQPYISDESNEKFAEALVADPDRFALSLLITLVGVALLLVAIVAARQVLRAAGEERWSFIAVPLVLIGGAFVAGASGAMLTAAAIADTSVDILAIAVEASEWVDPVFVVGGFGLGLGMLSLAMALYRTQVLGQRQTWGAVVALVVGAIGIFIPATGGGYLFALGLGVAFWLLAYRMWSESTAPALNESPAPAG